MGQRWGSFVSPLLAKNCCSPDENTNASLQSRHVSVRSWNTPRGLPCAPHPGPASARVRGRRFGRGARAGLGRICLAGLLRGQYARLSSTLARATDPAEPRGPAPASRAHVDSNPSPRRRAPRRPRCGRLFLRGDPLARSRRTRRRAPRPAPPPRHPRRSSTGIAHPTGAKDIVLRYDSAGGFVPAGVPRRARAVLHALRRRADRVRPDSSGAARAATSASASRSGPRCSPRSRSSQLLEFALTRWRPGGRARRLPEPADRGRPDGRVHGQRRQRPEDGLRVGLGMEDPQPGPDTRSSRARRARRAAAGLRPGGAIASTPTRRRPTRACSPTPAGVEAVPFRDWPWTDIKPADFTLPNDPNALQQATAVLTPEQAAALGVEGFENGIAGGIYCATTPARLYTFVLRPAAPRRGRLAPPGRRRPAVSSTSANRSPA